MKLPSFSVGKKQKELFLSLLLYPDAVDAAFWELEKTGEAFIAGAVTQEIGKDTWEERSDAADKCVSTLEAITKTENVQKVILGLPAEYLTEEGDVKKEVKQHVKKLTHLLELSPIGFVSIYQAIIHYYKHKEGVPPSLILLGMTSRQLTVTLYKVGNFFGHRVIEQEGSLIGHLEDALSSFTDIEILPSRILIYGTDRVKMEDAKRQILEHHWHQKTNFLHFPKAEVLAGDAASIAVSFAGAAELGERMVDEVVEEPEEVPEEAIEKTSEEVIEHELETPQEIVDEVIDTQHDVVDVVEGGMFAATHANVEPVLPEAFGFNEVEEDDEFVEDELPKRKNKLRIPLLLKSFGNRCKQVIKKKQPKVLPLILVPILFLVGIGFVLFTLVLPQATVAITVEPKDVQATEELRIVIDEPTTGTTIQGKSLEKSVDGEKTIPVTGKKTIGDAAKGTVTIFNKSTLPRTFKIGTVLSTGSIEFTLDADVQVASASETFTGSTFGKANAQVTAKEIGSKGNITAGREFSIAGVSSSIATARNDAAFSGGTSKEMTVVSRADQDNVIKQLTNDLIAEAKNGFAAAEGELLINETIKTQVKERTFSHEIGQEAKELQGKATIIISGAAFKESDVFQVMKEQLQSIVDAGYVLSTETVNVQSGAPITVRGISTVVATASGRLLPSFDMASLASQIQGKSISEAEALIKANQGIRTVSIEVSNSLWRDKLPRRANNIKISLETE